MQELEEKLISLKAPANFPKILTQREAVNRNLEYVRKRKSGEWKLLKTDYENLNRALGGGLEWNTMLSISALSGAGKSTFSKRIINAIINNSDEKAMVLSFNWEMLAHKTVGREISHLSKTKLKELYSSDNPIDDMKLNNIVLEYYEKLAEYPIVYVEEPTDYNTFGEMVYYYWKRLCAKDQINLIVEIDHAVICKGLNHDTQKDRIDKLMEEVNGAKKKISSEGGNVMFIALTQMNRNIKSIERKSVPEEHYPSTEDLFAASSIEFYSDYIIILHMPAKIHLSSYTDNKFPVWLGSKDEKENQETQFIYFHIIKQREGEPDLMIPMLNRLQYFDFEEIEEKDFDKYWEDFKKSNVCYEVDKSLNKKDKK